MKSWTAIPSNSEDAIDCLFAGRLTDHIIRPVIVGRLFTRLVSRHRSRSAEDSQSTEKTYFRMRTGALPSCWPITVCWPNLNRRVRVEVSRHLVLAQPEDSQSAEQTYIFRMRTGGLPPSWQAHGRGKRRAIWKQNQDTGPAASRRW